MRADPNDRFDTLQSARPTTDLRTEQNRHHDTDVLVIGGGPAGSTAATLLARQGWRVRLLEKERHPRFHIGESLLPMNLPILERLGVLEQVAAIGTYKPAADFPGDDGEYRSFRFDRALGRRDDHAYQVRRSEFDHLLLQHATAEGADIAEEMTVESVEARDDGGFRVSCRNAGGDASSVSARYVIDASGRETVLGRQFGLKQQHPRHRSAAIFGHYRGVSRRPGEDAGNITIYRLARGWVWMIPLADGVMSVGAVCDPDFLKQRRGALDRFLLDTVCGNADARERMRDAELVGEPQATGNYSYACREIGGRGWLLVGDAYAFVDPIFSSGVFLAMDSAARAADLVDQTLRDPKQETRLQREYRRRLDRGLGEFTWFIERFNTPVMRELFQNPRNTWQVEQAVIAMLAGDVFDNRPVLKRLRVFRLIYAITALRLRLRGPRKAPSTRAEAA